MPWWGWLIAGFLLLKGCGLANDIYTQHTGGPEPTIPTSAPVGGQ